MTTPDLPADRPIPDTDDLRLLFELVNNAYIPLSNAAWNARMSQSEAALRLVSMAERGLPLRLVADGDRQALWHITQAGPATSGVPATGGQAAAPSGPVAPPVPPASSGPEVPPVPPAGTPPVAAQLITAPPVAGPQGPGTPPSAATPADQVVLPPTPPVPPHEQAIAGAVPLGQPPFGQADSPSGSQPTTGPDAEHDAVRDAEPDAVGDAGHDTAPATGDEAPPAADQAVAPQAPPAADPGTSVTPPRWTPQTVHGPAGQQLVISILEVADPADQLLTDAGYRMDPGQRAVLVHSSVANTGEVPYYAVGDLYLVLETDQRVLLGRANVALASHPSFDVGVAPGSTADGWSVFLIPSQTVLAGLKWCIRPDIPQTIVGWPIAP